MKYLLLTLFISQFVWAKGYIVLFKQQEIAISSLEHGAFQELLQTSNKKSVTQLKDWLGTRGSRGAEVGDLWLIRGAHLDIDEAIAKKLAKEPWVSTVHANQTRKFINPSSPIIVGSSLSDIGGEELWGLKRIGLDKVKAEFPNLTGQGIRVGVIDTGVQSRHPELVNKKVIFKDFINGIASAYDDAGHGTHVAGTISGVKVGIAPDVSITFAKAFSAVGSATDATLLQSMQWIFDPDGEPGTNDFPNIVSNSWGGDLTGAFVLDLMEFAPYVAAIQAWIHGGIIPVFAAGNSGSHPNGFPGGLPDPIAVGAIDSESAVAEFSSRGPNLWKVGESVLTLLKPDVSAPGVNIPSAYPGNKYASMAGTSMATPHVAGVIALGMQANSKLKFADVKTLLLASSEKKADMSFGYGIVNAYEFVKAAINKR